MQTQVYVLNMVLMLICIHVLLSWWMWVQGYDKLKVYCVTLVLNLIIIIKFITFVMASMAIFNQK